MSLKTRCPACDTVFKIVPDQLKVSKGWVRCGRCAEVFDAAAHAAASDNANSWPQSSPSKASVQSKTVIAKNAEITPKNITAEAVNTPAIDDLLPTKDKLETDLTFVRVAKNKAFWQQSKVITSLRAACVALVSLLFVQVVFSQRNHLVAAHPPLASSFESVCQAIGCKIEPFRNIDAYKIDSSSFQKALAVAVDPAQADVFALKITLKNNSDLPLAMPAVELTLTEAGDKPVIRRVLLAKELGFNGATLAANADWTGDITLAVTTKPVMPLVSGYRVLLFYP